MLARTYLHREPGRELQGSGGGEVTRACQGQEGSLSLPTVGSCPGPLAQSPASMGSASLHVRRLVDGTRPGQTHPLFSLLYKVGSLHGEGRGKVRAPREPWLVLQSPHFLLCVPQPSVSPFCEWELTSKETHTLSSQTTLPWKRALSCHPRTGLLTVPRPPTADLSAQNTCPACALCSAPPGPSVPFAVRPQPERALRPTPPPPMSVPFALLLPTLSSHCYCHLSGSSVGFWVLPDSWFCPYPFLSHSWQDPLWVQTSLSSLSPLGHLGASSSSWSCQVLCLPAPCPR